MVYRLCLQNLPPPCRRYTRWRSVTS